MSIWPAPSVSQQPYVRLLNWSVFRINKDIHGLKGGHHLVGMIDGRDARVCSPIRTFDLDNRTAITRSGRLYQLVGDSDVIRIGGARDVDYILDRWLRVNGLTEDDVTFVPVSDIPAQADS